MYLCQCRKPKDLWAVFWWFHMCGYLCVCACVCACAHVCVCVCVCVLKPGPFKICWEKVCRARQSLYKLRLHGIMAASIPPTGARNSPQSGKRASRGLKTSRNVGEMRNSSSCLVKMLSNVTGESRRRGRRLSFSYKTLSFCIKSKDTVRALTLVH